MATSRWLAEGWGDICLRAGSGIAAGGVAAYVRKRPRIAHARFLVRGSAWTSDATWPSAHFCGPGERSSASGSITDPLRRPRSVTGSYSLRGCSNPAIRAPSTSPGAWRGTRRSEPEDARPRWSAKARPVPGPSGTSCRDRHRDRDSEACGQHVTLRRSAPPADHCASSRSSSAGAHGSRRSKRSSLKVIMGGSGLRQPCSRPSRTPRPKTCIRSCTGILAAARSVSECADGREPVDGCCSRIVKQQRPRRGRGVWCSCSGAVARRGGRALLIGENATVLGLCRARGRSSA